MYALCALIRHTNSCTFRLSLAAIFCSITSMAIKVPVLPTPALQWITTGPWVGLVALRTRRTNLSMELASSGTPKSGQSVKWYWVISRTMHTWDICVDVYRISINNSGCTGFIIHSKLYLWQCVRILGAYDMWLAGVCAHVYVCMIFISKDTELNGAQTPYLGIYCLYLSLTLTIKLPGSLHWPERTNNNGILFIILRRYTNHQGGNPFIIIMYFRKHFSHYPGYTWTGRHHGDGFLQKDELFKLFQLYTSS